MTTITLKVEVRLDAVPGVFADAETASMAVQNLLDQSIGHYGPNVTILDDGEITDDEAELRGEMYGHYLANAHEDAGYYYREADETGLVAVYRLGFDRGKRSANVD